MPRIGIESFMPLEVLMIETSSEVLSRDGAETMGMELLALRFAPEGSAGRHPASACHEVLGGRVRGGGGMGE